MEAEEPGAAAGASPWRRVQPFDRRGGRDESSSSSPDASRRRVEPVGEERESDVVLGGCEVVDLEAGDLFLDVRLGGQERRDHDERPKVGRHAAGQLEPRKDAGPQEVGDVPVDERDRQVGRGHEGEDREDERAGVRPPPPTARAAP